MELNITHLFKSDSFDAVDYSASVAELGPHAAAITRRNARQFTKHTPLFGEDDADEIRDWLLKFGAWERDELEDLGDLNALTLQFIAGYIREIPVDDDGEPDWEAAEALAEEGQISGLIFKRNDGDIYFYVGC
jgi:hypothetical protein